MYSVVVEECVSISTVWRGPFFLDHLSGHADKAGQAAFEFKSKGYDEHTKNAKTCITWPCANQQK